MSVSFCLILYLTLKAIFRFSKVLNGISPFYTKCTTNSTTRNITLAAVKYAR